MENDLYKMMIVNVNSHVATIDTVNPKVEDITIFQISEVLAICTGKLKEDIVMDIISYNKTLTFQERVNLFYLIWGQTTTIGVMSDEVFDQVLTKQIQHISFYFNMQINDERWKDHGSSVSRDQIQQLIVSKFIIYGSLSKEKLIEIMDYQNVPKTTNDILYQPNTKILLLLNNYPENPRHLSEAN